jgi:hypothetical protein
VAAGELGAASELLMGSYAAPLSAAEDAATRELAASCGRRAAAAPPPGAPVAQERAAVGEAAFPLQASGQPTLSWAHVLLKVG